MQESLDRIEKKVDNINTNLTLHLGRISVLEESVQWLKGHVKITITLAIATITGLAATLAKLLIK